MFVITGGAGFIGSNIAAQLDDAGSDIVIVDWLGNDDHKWRNISKRRLVDILLPQDAIRALSGSTRRLEGIFHMGAISTTTERDVDAIVRDNIRSSIDLWHFAAAHGVPFIYASSAATYGDGRSGFVDRADPAFLAGLRPLNAYGWSKHVCHRSGRG